MSDNEAIEDHVVWEDDLLNSRPLLQDTVRCFAEVRAALLLTERTAQLAARAEIARVEKAQAEADKLRCDGSAAEDSARRAADRVVNEARRDATALRREVKEVRIEMEGALADGERRKRAADRQVSKLIEKHAAEAKALQASVTKLKRELKEVEYFKQQMADLGQLDEMEAENADEDASPAEDPADEVEDRQTTTEKVRKALAEVQADLSPAKSEAVKRRRKRKVDREEEVVEEKSPEPSPVDYDTQEEERRSERSEEKDVGDRSASRESRRSPSNASRRGEAGAKGRGKAGKGKGKKRVCIPFIMGRCNLGDTCSALHVSKSDGSRLMEGLRSKPCKDGASCRKKDCMFKHEGRDERKADDGEDEDRRQDDGSRDASRERSAERSGGESEGGRKALSDDRAEERPRSRSRSAIHRVAPAGGRGRSRSRSAVQRRPAAGGTGGRDGGEERAPLARQSGKTKGGGKAGKGKGDLRMCIPYIMGRCTQGDSCTSMHVARGDSSRLLDGLKKKVCRDGAKCIKKDCIFKHPDGWTPKREDGERSPLTRRKAQDEDAADAD